MDSLKDKVVIITGGGAGIGLAPAHDFAAAGAKVLITGRRQAVLDEVTAGAPNMKALGADASVPAGAQRTVARDLDHCGRLDVLVNNAGTGTPTALADASLDRINAIYVVNVIGPALLAAAAVPHLEASGGSVINISSTLAQKPVPGFADYAASKAALEQLTRCWALELAPKGIQVNAVGSPGRDHVPPGADGSVGRSCRSRRVRGEKADPPGTKRRTQRRRLVDRRPCHAVCSLDHLAKS